MVDVKTQTKPHHDSKHETKQTKPVNPRAAIREARQRRLRLVKGDANAVVKVYAASEPMRAVLRHPNGTRFRSTLDQGVEWPNDSFTKRRIADGSVRIDGAAASGDPAPVDESLNPRQQSATRIVKQEVKQELQERLAHPEHPIAPPEGQRPEATLRLAKLSPNTAVAGAEADIVMSCIGTGFTKETVIKFGDYDEPTTFVSATEVTTGVRPSLFINPDTVPVLVHTGEVSSDALTFTFTAPAPQAAKASPKPVHQPVHQPQPHRSA